MYLLSKANYTKRRSKQKATKSQHHLCGLESESPLVCLKKCMIWYFSLLFMWFAQYSHANDKMDGSDRLDHTG
ncbi:hypothetical protein HanIR_Chr11g0523251 [Helianthus annuus]|nr:hypothetical protein HanIR_Chr11g0523251 [Helianthus annuus]